jgi:putative transposase
MIQKQSPREVALARFQVISPLVDPLHSAEDVRLRLAEVLYRQACHPDSPSLSERTIRRWVVAYREHGFDGLLPKVRNDRGVARTMKSNILDTAIALKREVPQRSVRQIIETMEMEGLIKVGEVKRSTLSQHFRNLGLTKLSKQPALRGTRRFCKAHRNCLWQADLKYGPYLPDPLQRKKFRRSYLIAFIDDYSRLICHAEFYFEQKSEQLEHCLKRAILKRGIPDKLYVDNGKIFVSHWLRLACARLNVRHISAAPFAPESKGKIEKFMQRCEEFIAEMTLVKPKTLDDLNQLFGVWLEEGYNHHPHSALEGKSPADVFVTDNKQLRYVGINELQQAFLWEEIRKVDKVGCIKFRGKSYDVGPDLRGNKVAIRFDPQDDSELLIIVDGELNRKAYELRINKPFTADESYDPFADVNDEKPARPSRYLQGLATKEQQRRERKLGAISYRDLGVQDV